MTTVDGRTRHPTASHPDGGEPTGHPDGGTRERPPPGPPADVATTRPVRARPDRLRRPGPAVNAAASVTAVGLTLVLAPQTLVGLAVAGVSAVCIEVLWPLHDRRRPGRGLLTDLAHAVGNRYLVLPVIGLLIALAHPLAVRAVPEPAFRWVHGLPWWGQLAVVFAATDLANYLAHRAMHRVPVLWRFHAVHHSSEHLDWLATSRVHPVDLALTITAATLPAYALGYAQEHPWLLTVLFLYPFYAHANAGLRLPGLERVVVSPSFHHWHHAADPAAHDRNFGAILTVWDHLGRTAHRPGGFPDRYGIGDPGLDDAGYAGHLLAPFLPRRPATAGGDGGGADG